MIKLKVTMILLVIGCVLYLSGDDNKQRFNDMNKEGKINFMDGQVIKYKTDITELVKYFEANWDKETDEVKVSFCKLMATYRANESLSLLVKNFDFCYLGIERERPRTILEGRFALNALAQIGTPSLEPVSERIYTELEKLTYSEDTRHRIHFLKEALKYLLVETIGKKLSVVFLEDKINNTNTSAKLKECLSGIAQEIKQK
ncbi:MAG: hypothetical protein HY811_09060 [Planctomycetes bacterium]|nr:hypothetical protein [Planctomycetota bacterium]